MTIAYPAWTFPSGQHQIITPAGRQTQPASPTRPLTYSAVGLTALSAVVWFAYSHLGWDRLVTVGQILALLAGVCVIAILHLHAQQQQRQAARAAVHRHITAALGEGVNAIHGLDSLRTELRRLADGVTAYRGALVDLPEELRDRQDRQAAGYQTLVGEIGDRLADRLGALEQAVGERLVEIDRRIEAVEQRADDGQHVAERLDRIEAVLAEVRDAMDDLDVVAEALGQARAGTVRLVHPNGSAPRR